jgi:hypothetical protein
MNVFGNLTTEGLEEQGDRLGGFAAIPTDAYIATIKAMYAGKASASNAQNVTILADINGTEYRETIYITNKQGQNFFHPKDGKGNRDTTKRNPLPGFSVVNDICLFITGKPLNEQTTEEKQMNVYDVEAKKELPKSVQVISATMGEPIGLAIIREIVFKQEKNSNDEYVDTNETRIQNNIDKVFHPTMQVTASEVKHTPEGKTPEADFIPKWTEQNKGKDRDKTKGKSSGEAPKSGKPGAAGNSASTPSLFGNKS